MDPEAASPLLALDIGTHKVAAVLAAPVAADGHERLHLLGAFVLPQFPGAMRGGQIEDVEQVARTVARVLDRLRRQSGVSLPEQATVAAAGRSLRIANGTARSRLSAMRRLDAVTVRSLEMEAVQEAARTLEGPGSRRPGEARPAITPETYLCAGYSVGEYRLDGRPVPYPVGQRGHRLEVEVVATFLPRGVLDALLGVLERVGLAPAGLTLEPIAALEVAVPPTLRHLNLALVDVGAGTSDLALTRDGRVVAYGMVAEAGDRVTAYLARRYLLDVREAERLKRAAAQEPGPLEAVNVLGQRVALNREEVLGVVGEVARHLADHIAAECLRLNGGKAPDAMLLVGGGSLTPGLLEALAEATGLPPDRVARRDRGAVEGISGGEDVLAGPDAVTPLGIAAAAWRGRVLKPLSVRVNGQPVTAFGDGARATVAEVLMSGGYAPRDLVGRPGASLSVEVNGRLVTVPGEPGHPAPVRKNGSPVRLGDWVNAGDELEVGEPRPGADAVATVADVCELPPPLAVTLQGRPVEIPPEVRVDGRPAAPTDRVADRSRIEVRLPHTVGEVLERAGIEDRVALEAAAPLRVWLNGTELEIRPARLWVNGQPAHPDRPVASGDRIEWAEPGEGAAGRTTVRDLLAMPARPSLVLTVPVTVNGQPVALDRTPLLAVRVNGRPADLDTELSDGDRVELWLPADRPPMVSDLFVQVDPRPEGGPRAGVFWIRVNGEPAGFTTPLSAGDRVEWGWRKPGE